MKILALNCGSSSAKYQLYDWEKKQVLCKGLVEKVVVDEGKSAYIKHKPSDKEPVIIEKACPTHKEALQLIFDTLVHPQHGIIKDVKELDAIGHRVVHGSMQFARSFLINQELIDKLQENIPLAPLHNPANIQGIQAAKELMPSLPQIAVFDTAFHQTMPDYAFLYGVPYEWYEKYSVRRYGFNGTSHLYVSKRAAVLLDKPYKECNIITMHIGNGVSHAAIKNGICIDTSMGMTPLEGAIMGTRSGDLDASILPYICRMENKTIDEVEIILNKESGLKGITGKYTDRRDIENAAKEGDKRAQLSIEMESYRLKKYLGAYYAALGRVDAVVFTAGVGENSPLIRAKTCENLESMGIILDKEINEKTFSKEVMISKLESKVKVFVIPTNEELVFIEDVVAILKNTYDVHTNFTYSFQSKEYKP